MRVVLFIFASCLALAAQAYSFNVNTDIATHTFTLPLVCPSTNPANCAGPASNQAYNGAGSIWAECNLSAASSFHNPECTQSPLTPITSGTAVNPNYVHLIRATDLTTRGTSGTGFFGGPSAQWADNAWEITAQRFLVGVVGGTVVPFMFDPDPASPTFLKATKLYGTNYFIAPGTNLNLWCGRQAPVLPRTIGYCYILMNSASVPGLTGVPAGRPVITRWDFTNTVTAPTIPNGGVAVVADLFSVPGCLSAPFVWGGTGYPSQSVFSVSLDDSVFYVGLNDGSGYYNVVVVYDKNQNKCAIWNTVAGTITDYNGVVHTNIDVANNDGTNPIQFDTHQVQGYGRNGLVYIEGAGSCSTGAPYTCTTNCGTVQNPRPCCHSTNCGKTGNNTFQRWAWDTTTNAVYALGSGDNCGHNANGYTHMENKCPTSFFSTGGVANWVRDYQNSNRNLFIFGNNFGLSNFNCYIINPDKTTAGTSMGTVCPNPSTHQSWVTSTTPNDDAPALQSAYNDNVTPYPGPALVMSQVPESPLVDEIHLFPTACWPNCTSSNHPYRITQTFSNPALAFKASLYYYQEAVSSGAITPVPNHGQMFITFASNWSGQLGCFDGTTLSTSNPLGYDCPTHHRFDVFIAQLPVAGAAPPVVGTYYFPARF